MFLDNSNSSNFYNLRNKNSQRLFKSIEKIVKLNFEMGKNSNIRYFDRNIICIFIECFKHLYVLSERLIYSETNSLDCSFNGIFYICFIYFPLERLEKRRLFFKFHQDLHFKIIKIKIRN